MPMGSLRILYVLIIAILLVGAPIGAQWKMGPVQVTIMPDHPDWNYTPGEKAVFDIKVTKNGKSAAGLKLDWSVGPDLLPPLRTGTADLSEEGTARVDAGTRRDAGFLRFSRLKTPCTTTSREGRSTLITFTTSIIRISTITDASTSGAFGQWTTSLRCLTGMAKS